MGVDLVITDQAMPEMTGLELVRQTRMTRPTLPVIVMSGFAELPNDVGPEIQKLAKPCSQQALRQAVLEASSALSKAPD